MIERLDNIKILIHNKFYTSIIKINNYNKINIGR